MAIKDMFRDAEEIRKGFSGFAQGFGNDMSRSAMFSDPEKDTIQQAPITLVMSQHELSELRGVPSTGETYFEQTASARTSSVESLYADFMKKVGGYPNRKKLSSEQFSDIYMSVTPKEELTSSWYNIEPTPTPARTYSERDLNLLRTRAIGLYREKQESDSELLLSPEERFVVLNLFNIESGSPKVTWATAAPTENGVSMKETFTHQHLFDVISPDGSPIDLNRVGDYPISNPSDFMSRFTLLSSHGVQETNSRTKS